jgi:hypothetical protein
MAGGNVELQVETTSLGRAQLVRELFGTERTPKMLERKVEVCIHEKRKSDACAVGRAGPFGLKLYKAALVCKIAATLIIGTVTLEDTVVDYHAPGQKCIYYSWISYSQTHPS